MSEGLTVHSAMDLGKLESRELYLCLKRAADTLESLENHIANVNAKKSDIEYKYGRTEGFSKTRIVITPIIVFSIFPGLLVFYIGKELLGIALNSAISTVIAIIIAMVIVAFLCILTKHMNSVGRNKMSELHKQEELAMQKFERELNNSENVIAIIPDKYRISIILYKFCEYLNDGEAATWERCIEIFKTDVHRANIESSMNEIISNLQAIETNTRANAIFAGITAWNTL